MLGEEYAGNAFTCEPVGNLVYRLQLKESEDGVLVTGARAPGEAGDEFLASRDNWFRPVQAKTGPDGALFVGSPDTVATKIAKVARFLGIERFNLNASGSRRRDSTTRCGRHC